MSDAPRWRRYLRFVRPDAAADVDDEIAFHVTMRVERNIALGMTPEAARADALERFGDLAAVRRVLVAHDERRWQSENRREYLMDFLQDLRFGWRALRRAPGFTIAATLTLALGIGANAAIFSVVDAIVLRPLPYREPHRLVSIGTGSAGEFLGLRERLRSVSQLGVWVPQTHPIDIGDETLRLEGAGITTNLLAMLGVSPRLGRDFADEEGGMGKNTVLLLSDALWRERFGASPEVIGKRVLVEGVPVTIIGVMPEDFHFPTATTRYWMPQAFNPGNPGMTWGVVDKHIIARLAPGVTFERLQREVREVWPTLRHLNPLWDPGAEYRRDASPKPLQDNVVGATGRLLWMLFGCVLLVLLVGCVNVANLLLARATSRARELAVRAALGGGRGRLLRQLVTESLLLAALGASLGIGIAIVAVRWLVAAMPPGIPRAEEISVNGTVVAFTAIVAILTGILFGIIPALRATRIGQSASTVSIGRRTSHDAQHQRVSGVLVTAEVAFAVLLVVVATLLARSFAALRSVDLGIDTSHVIAARITPPHESYRDSSRVTQLYQQLLERLSALPGVATVAVTDKLPFGQVVWGVALRVQGQYEDAKHILPSLGHQLQVTPGYFQTMRIPILRGRPFTDTDRGGQPPVAIVSESVARMFWPNGDALGKRIGFPWDSPWMTIVGIVPDTRQDSLRDTSRTSVYTPWDQSTLRYSSENWVVVRTHTDPAPLAAAIRAVVRGLDRSVAVSDARTMDVVVSDSVQKARFTMLLVGAFAVAALLLGAIGIYGVMTYLVSQRTQEMGIRLALGATTGGVIGLVVGRAARLAALGALVGIVAALFTTRWLAGLLYGISATDPLTFAMVPLGFLAIAVLASYVPAHRATRIDPVRALRAE
ncbi:MAG TPA: ABC transporter permease [Gemmatimonadaceae bacterium]|nr:ABC transporter permease [Gemmatimonadaceae bacterium]